MRKAGIARLNTEYWRKRDGKADDVLQYALEWAFFARCQWDQYDTALIELENTWDKNKPSPQNIIVEDGIAESNGGRRAGLYSLNYKFGYIVGHNLGINNVSTYVFDLDLKLLYEHVCAIPLQYNQTILDITAGEIENALAEADIKPEGCFGIGVSVPGQVNYVNGVIENIPHMAGWRHIPIKAISSRKLE